jgi:N-acetylmuramoyl-L-alanine amidase
MLGSRFLRRTGSGLTVLVVLALGGAAPASATSSYHVVPGDTLYSIAARFGTSIQEIVALNGLPNPNLIFAGQNLTLPGEDNTQQATVTPIEFGGTYVVQPGDTLWGIASRYGITVAQLVEMNRHTVSNQDLIFVDQVLNVPGSGDSGGGSLTPIPDPPAHSADIETLLEQTANAYGIDPALVKAIAWQESGWQQNAVSSSGALGVMQVMPATGGWIATELVGRPLDIAGSPSDNILAGVVYLEWLIRYTGDEYTALAAYYQGPGSVSRHGLFNETIRYVDNVYAIRAYIQQHGTPPRS